MAHSLILRSLIEATGRGGRFPTPSSVCARCSLLQTRSSRSFASSSRKHAAKTVQQVQTRNRSGVCFLHFSQLMLTPSSSHCRGKEACSSCSLAPVSSFISSMKKLEWTEPELQHMPRAWDGPKSEDRLSCWTRTASHFQVTRT